MATKLKLTGARVGEAADSLVLVGEAADGSQTEIEFTEQNGEELLAALVSIIGQHARRRTEDRNLKKILPVEWWQIDPHPSGGLTMGYRLPGGMEMNFHLPASAVAPFEEVLRSLSGSLPTPPAGIRN